jgi:hypothetical protein
MVALFIKHRDPKIVWTFGQDSYPPITFDLDAAAGSDDAVLN